MCSVCKTIFDSFLVPQTVDPFRAVDHLTLVPNIPKSLGFARITSEHLLVMESIPSIGSPYAHGRVIFTGKRGMGWGRWWAQLM